MIVRLSSAGISELHRTTELLEHSVTPRDENGKTAGRQKVISKPLSYPTGVKGKALPRYTPETGDHD